MLHLLAPRRVERAYVEVGVLASGALALAAGSSPVAAATPVTVAAQRWTRTSFHLYALTSGLSGHLDEIELFTFRTVARLYHTDRLQATRRRGERGPKSWWE